MGTQEPAVSRAALDGRDKGTVAAFLTAPKINRGTCTAELLVASTIAALCALHGYVREL